MPSPIVTQAVIDRQTFNFRARPFGAAIQCDGCRASQLWKVFSYRVDSGWLYFNYASELGFDPLSCLALCRDCWPRWLMWRARMGYDLHHHTRDDECGADCLANMGGRRAQFHAQMSTFGDRPAAFFLVKAIDGQPTQNGTQLIMSQRSGYFSLRPFTKQLYYESIADVDELVRQILFTAQLREIGLPQHMADGYLLVFETFQSAYNAERGVLAHPTIGDSSIGFHCVYQTGYTDSGENLRFINSWGRNWGIRGFGTVSLDYLRKYFYEAFVIRNARWGHAPWKFHNVAPGTLSNRQVRQRLMVENPVDTILIKRSRNDVWKLNHCGVRGSLQRLLSSSRTVSSN